MGKLSIAIPVPLEDFSFVGTFRGERQTLLELSRLRHALGHGSVDEKSEAAVQYYGQLLPFYLSLQLAGAANTTTIVPTQFSWHAHTLVDDFSDTNVPYHYTDSSLLFELACAALCTIAANQNRGDADSLRVAHSCARQMRTELLPGLTPRVFCGARSKDGKTLIEKLRSGVPLDAGLAKMPREPHLLCPLFFQALEDAIEAELHCAQVNANRNQRTALQQTMQLSRASRCYEKTLALLPHSSLLLQKHERCQSFMYKFLSTALVKELSESSVAVACALEAVQWAGDDSALFRAHLQQMQDQNNKIYVGDPPPDRSSIQLVFENDGQFRVDRSDPNRTVRIHIPIGDSIL